MTKYAVISTDNNPDYYSLVPLCCYSWRKLGFKPIVIIVNTPTATQSSFLECKCPPSWSRLLRYDKVGGVRDSTIAQIERIYISLKPIFKDDDIIITGDTDMIQAKDIFSEHIGPQFVNFGFDLTGRGELPICYNLATAKVWRELIGEYTIPETAYSDDKLKYWGADQQLLTQRAKEYGLDKIKFVDRGTDPKNLNLPKGRWDRYNWKYIPEDIIDIHMPRNNFDAQIQVFKRLWPGDDYEFLIKFKEELNKVQ